MVEFLTIAAEQEKFSLVSIDPSTIVFTLINTLIIVALYFFFLHKPVCKILDERAKTVNAEMDEAEEAKKQAAATKAEYEARLSDSKAEAERIVADATKRARAREEEIISAANNEATALKERAEESIKKEKQRAVTEIRKDISDMVIMAASKVAQKEIDKSTNEDIINSVLDGIEKEN